MTTSLEHHPECLGFIDLHYGTECHECNYAAMCTYIAVTEKWSGPKFHNTNDNDTYPIGDRKEDDHEIDKKESH